MAAPKNPVSLGLKSDKEWRDEIRKAVHGLRAAKDEKGKTQKVRALRLIAEKMVDCAIAGDMTAIKEIGDRLDGRSPQSVTVTQRNEVSELDDAQLDSRIVDALERVDQLAARAKSKGNGADAPDTVH